MSLEIKQELKTFEDKYLPKFLKKMSDATGTQIKFEVDASTFNEKVDVQMLSNGFCDRFAEAVAKVCRNDLGKEAFKGFVHTVKVKCVPKDKMKDEMRFEVKDGVFYAAGAWGQSGGYFGADDYRKYIEKNAA